LNKYHHDTASYQKEIENIIFNIHQEKQMQSTLPWYQHVFVNDHQMNKVITTLRNELATV
jgi:hypothetical protein